MLYFERKEETAPENIYQNLEVTLTKKSGKTLGLSVVGRRDGPGVFISALVSIICYLAQIWFVLAELKFHGQRYWDKYAK